MKFNFILIIFHLFFTKIHSKNFTGNDLYNHIIDNQYHSVIPFDTHPINLTLSVAIRAFNSINQMEGSLSTNIWLRYNWKDNYYSWNPDKWNNIKSIKMNTDPEIDNHIWTPDIYLYNTAEKPMDELDYSRADLDYNGNVFWSRPGLVKSSCYFDLTNFPYDIQTCKLKFGSWAYDSKQINLILQSDSIDISNLQRHEEWELIKFYQKKNSIKYPCCEFPYEDIEFYFILKRNYGYYNLNIIIPTFATATLMLMTLLVPWDSGERISFAVTILLSIIVFLLILSDNLPKSDKKPLLSRMIIGLVYFSLIGVFFTIIINALHSYIDKKKYKNNNILNKLLGKIIQYVRHFKKCKTKKIDESDSNKTDNVFEEYCDNITNFVEYTYMSIFLIGFISYCIVMFNQIPD